MLKAVCLIRFKPRLSNFIVGNDIHVVPKKMR